MGEKTTDRRKTGINRVVISDGNGGEQIIWTAAIERAKVWIGFVLAVSALVTVVFGAVRFGVGVEVHQAIDNELEPGGSIQQTMMAVSEEYIGEVQGVIQDDLDYLGSRVDTIEQTGRDLQAGQIRINERFDEMAERVDRNQDEIMRMLHQAADSSQ